MKIFTCDPFSIALPPQHSFPMSKYRLVFGFCRDCRLPVAVTLAGGYAPDIEDIVDIHFQTVQAAVDFFQCRKENVLR
jgi:hypothetical protein